MYNNNYWKIRGYVEKTVPPTAYTNVDIGIQNKSGEDVQIQVITGNGTHPEFSSIWNMALCSRLVLGTGDTAATAEDYALEDDITASLSNVTQSYTCGADDDSLKVVYSISFTNSTGSDIVIREVGIETDVADTSRNKFQILTARQVLNTPITVPAGGGKVITINAQTK